MDVSTGEVGATLVSLSGRGVVPSAAKLGGNSKEGSHRLFVSHERKRKT